MRAGSKAQAAALEAYLRGPKSKSSAAVRRAKVRSTPDVVKPEWRVYACVSDPGRWWTLLDARGLRTVNELNNGLTWREMRGKGSLGEAQKLAVSAAVRDWLASPFGGPAPSPPYVVTLARLAPSKGLDDDGLRAAMKRVRDTVAKELGVGDGPTDPVEWKYDQRRGPWGVSIKVEWREAPKEGA